MKILDSNIIIYASQPDFAFLRPLLTDPNSYVSELTKLEVLGYHLLDANAKPGLGPSSLKCVSCPLMN